MPLTSKGEEIMRSMTASPSKGGYGAKKGEEVFYASRNKGTITGVDSAKLDAALSKADAFNAKLAREYAQDRK